MMQSLSDESANEEEEIALYFDRLVKTTSLDDAPNDEQCPTEDNVNTVNGEEVSQQIPDENRIEKTPYVEPKRGTDPEKLRKIIQNLHSMRGSELRALLKEAHLSSQGTRKQLLERVRKYYRKEWATHRIRTDNDNMPSSLRNNKTLRYFEYLVVIDFECTCEEILYDYPHEIIEFPAILVDVEKQTIVDTFRSFVRPELRPILDPFCIEFCGITQEMVDSAPVFKDVLQSFRMWMRKHNLGEENRRFAFVADGPHDLWKFFQYNCILSGIGSVPHEFRCWINLKKIFEQRVAKLEKNVQGEPRVSSIEKMLKAYNKPFSGQKHCGVDDATNLAVIVIEMLRDKEHRLELRINQRTRRKRDRYDNVHVETNNPENDYHLWIKKLPLMHYPVSREEFLSGQYLDCDSCDEQDV